MKSFECFSKKFKVTSPCIIHKNTNKLFKFSTRISFYVCVFSYVNTFRATHVTHLQRLWDTFQPYRMIRHETQQRNHAQAEGLGNSLNTFNHSEGGYITLTPLTLRQNLSYSPRLLSFFHTLQYPQTLHRVLLHSTLSLRA